MAAAKRSHELRLRALEQKLVWFAYFVAAQLERAQQRAQLSLIELYASGWRGGGGGFPWRRSSHNSRAIRFSVTCIRTSCAACRTMNASSHPSMLQRVPAPRDPRRMPDEENTETQDVGTPETTEPLFLNEAERVLHEQAAPEQPVIEHTRIGGQPGVRVQHFSGGVTTQKRVTAIDQHPQGDFRQVPVAVLAEARELLYVDQPLSAADTVRAVRDLLDPWL